MATSFEGSQNDIGYKVDKPFHPSTYLEIFVKIGPLDSKSIVKKYKTRNALQSAVL